MSDRRCAAKFTPAPTNRPSHRVELTYGSPVSDFTNKRPGDHPWRFVSLFGAEKMLLTNNDYLVDHVHSILIEAIAPKVLTIRCCSLDATRSDALQIYELSANIAIFSLERTF